MKFANFLALFLVLLSSASSLKARTDSLFFKGAEGEPGLGKKIVLLAGDEEYRSEEALPMLAQLLARQGFDCTVLFSLDKEGNVDPTASASLSNSEALDSADLIVMSLRFRAWEDAAMERFDAALRRGVPIVALRTSTHAFKFDPTSKWAKYSFNSKGEWPKGFGREILGETWLSHHGQHKVEGCRGIPEPGNESHPVLRGVGEIFVESDVYEAHPPEDVKVLLRGLVTKTLEPDSPAVEGEKNSPVMPVVWVRELPKSKDRERVQRVVTTTMGAASDLDDENLRRLVVNGVFWGLGLEVPKSVDVEIEGEFEPTFYGFNTFKKGLKPADFVIKPSGKGAGVLELKAGDRIAIVGGALGERMVDHGFFEAELYRTYPELDLVIRNLCNSGDTPVFRPHGSRELQFAFEGAEKYAPMEYQVKSNGIGIYQSPDEWLTTVAPDKLMVMFGFTSSFDGQAGVKRFKEALTAYVHHVQGQKYNGSSAPEIVLVSPIAADMKDEVFQKQRTTDLALYTSAIAEVANDTGVLFVDLFNPSAELFSQSATPLTIDGAQMNELGYKKLAPILSMAVFGIGAYAPDVYLDDLLAAVRDKNWIWHNDYNIPNGVHTHGRRYKPFGPSHFPAEIQKMRELAEVRDRAIHAICRNKPFDLAAEDAKTKTLPVTKTNYKPSGKNGSPEYLAGEESLKKITLPDGFEISLFADEKQFPSLANPVQMSFDNQGRLWVACMPSYPHWQPGDPRPNDKLIILEDTDGDGKADKETIFADGLHLPLGFEFTPGGVYLSEADRLSVLVDSDGDDRADRKEVLFYGFDDQDSHHAIGAFCADPSGAIYMSEGVFLHSNVETAYGTVRGRNGGFFRVNPRTHEVRRTAQLSIPNPWGTAFDEWGQPFFLFTSGTNLNWMTRGEMKPTYDKNFPFSFRGSLITKGAIRPTSGLEILSSRHFPEDMQGDLLLNNTIGFLGTRQHALEEDGTGYTLKLRQDLLSSSDGNFRPVDLEIAPDGSLYVIDWSNVLIGHMQHSQRDPLRDHVHGRVFRITCTSRDLVKPAKIAGATIPELLENLKLPELRTRYRTRSELRTHDAREVVDAVESWVSKLDAADPAYPRLLCEALWVTWGAEAVSEGILDKVLTSSDHRARAAGTRVVRFNLDTLPDSKERLLQAAGDQHGRVRMEALIGASWLPSEGGLEILGEVEKQEVDPWIKESLGWVKSSLNGGLPNDSDKEQINVPKHLAKTDASLYSLGHEVFSRDAHCYVCHQKTGQGLDPIYPPLAGSEWVTGNEERLIKLVLNGLTGAIEVNGKAYGDVVPPMMGFKDLIPSDNEVAAVLTYVRNSWGNKATAVSPQKVKEVRATLVDRIEPWTAEELLEAHPMPTPKK